MRSLLIAGVLTAAQTATAGILPPRGSPPTVRTSSGTIQGFVAPQFPDVEQFLGVPFAAPPLGDLRFAPPVPPKVAKDVIVANKQPPACLQVPNMKNIFNELEPGFKDHGPQDENCLFLDVYKPSSARKGNLMPVIIFLFGGAFIEGGVDELYQLPTPWIQRTKDVLVVKPAYRLNIFGSPNAAGLKKQNVGLLDQRMAVEWVKNNIEQFGGDPNRIILWGQSAGSISADIYSYSYASNPLIAGHICTSGTALIPPPLWQSQDYPHSNFSSLARTLGCKTSDPASELACMRRQSGKSIQNAIISSSTSGNPYPLSFKPIPDNSQTLANDYVSLASSGSFANLPAIYGSNRKEGEFQASNLSTSEPNQLKANGITVVAFLCPSALSAKLRQRSKPALPTYRYEYAGNFSNISPLPWMGAYHGSILPLIFGTHDVEAAHPGQQNSTVFEYEVSRKMQDFWGAFAKNPAGGDLEAMGWKRNMGGNSRSEADAVMLFGQRWPRVVNEIEYGAMREGFCPLAEKFEKGGFMV